MPTIQRIQAESETWRAATYGDRSIEHRAMKLTEEAAEVSKVLTRRAERRPAGNMADELADVFLTLCGVASKEGIDLEQAILARWQVVRQRT